MQRFDRISTGILCLTICLAVLWLWLPVPAGATAKNNAEPFRALQKKLIQDGFNSDKITRLYSRSQVFFETDGVTILFTYSEAKVDYDQFANDWSISKAKKYMQKHRENLDRVEKAYGVDSRVITAILLVETGLGTTVGTRSTLKSREKGTCREISPGGLRPTFRTLNVGPRHLTIFLKWFAFPQQINPTGVELFCFGQTTRTECANWNSLTLIYLFVLTCFLIIKSIPI